MFTDPIADYLTRVRNAQMAGHKVVEIPASNMKKAITQILHAKGYILNFKFEETANNQGNIKVALKYNAQTKLPAMKKLIRISKPGLRKYADSKNLPRVINGLGIAILSTSKGIITDKEAKKFKCWW
jgi:small subunit ribosomal protein S8